MRSLVAPVIASVAVHTALMLAARHAPESLARHKLLMPMRVAQPKKADEPKAPPPKPVHLPRRPPTLVARPTAPPPPQQPPAPPPPPPQGFSVDTHKTVDRSSVAVAAREGGGNMFADPNDDALPAPKTTAPSPPSPPPPPRFEAPELLTDELSRMPPYPSAALRAEIDGQVLLRVCIGISGAVDTVQVVKGLGFGCDEAASSWAKSHWRFRPARRLGTPVSYCIMQPVRFQLQR